MTTEDEDEEDSNSGRSDPEEENVKEVSKSDQHMEKLRKKLDSGQFRSLNEQLYTQSGDLSATLFNNDPRLFDTYHRGFRSQTMKWPVKPVDIIAEKIEEMNPLPNVVVDLGCGEAELALRCEEINERQRGQKKNKKKGIKVVHSFDLVAPNERVRVANMTKVPLRENCADVVVYCLSLMGTDYPKAISEGLRILKEGGKMIVAEVSTRFESDDGGGRKVNFRPQFVSAMQSRDLEMTSRTVPNDMFELMEFRKGSRKELTTEFDKPFPALAATIYKKR